MADAHPDEAIVLRVRPLGERAGGVAVLFGREHGVIRGMVNLSRKDVAMLCVGSVVGVERWRRLESQLGKLTLEPIWNAGALVLADDRRGALLVGWLVELLEVFLPEEHAYPKLFRAANYLLRAGIDEVLGRRVAEFERLLLEEIGYGMALGDDPVVVENNEVLRWVSPNSGRAVGEKAGAEYADKLLILPEMWGGMGGEGRGTGHGEGGMADVGLGLRLTGHFLLSAGHGKVLEARGRLVEALGRAV